MKEDRQIIATDDTRLWVNLSRVPQLGTVPFRRLEAHFGNLENVWKASFGELKAAGLEDRPAREVMAARNNSSPDDEMSDLERAGVTAVTWNHPGYPARLKEIADPPAVLFYKIHCSPATTAQCPQSVPEARPLTGGKRLL